MSTNAHVRYTPFRQMVSRRGFLGQIGTGLGGIALSSLLGDALARIAGELGADVPFFLVPGPQLGEGDGSALRLLDMPQLQTWSDRWQLYMRRWRCSRRALVQKALFKVLYY